MTAFACMFLVKVAVKYGGDLVEPGRVWDLTTNLVRHFRSLPAGRWHLANLMAPGLEKMAATLRPDREGDAGRVTGQAMTSSNGVDAALDPQLGGPGTDGTFIGSEGEFFFDYNMNFGLSPVFQFDLSSLNADNAPMTAPEFGSVEYQMPGPGS